MVAKKTGDSCDLCGRDLLLYKCKYCDKVFCDEHRLPQKHQCAGLAQYNREMSIGVIKPGVADAPESPGQYQRSRVPAILITGTVLAFKIISVVLLVAAAIFIMIFLIGYVDTNVRYLSNTLPVTNLTGAQVVLTNNRSAADVSYGELVAFLNQDATSTMAYVSPNFTCADFARTLHDRAEARGIRAAFVAVDYDPDRAVDFSVYHDGTGIAAATSVDVGHGLNLFNTTDKGPVYVDASSISGYNAGDRIAYVAQGKELNEIDLSFAGDPRYAFYEDYRQNRLACIADLRAYNQNVSAYNAEVNSYNGTIPRSRAGVLDQMAVDLTARKSSLDARQAALGPFYYPTGIVKEVTVYW